MYIFDLDNVLRYDLSRLTKQKAIGHGELLGYVFVDVDEIDISYFAMRLSEFAAISPSDNHERMNAIAQYVEKRIARRVAPSVLRHTAIVAFWKMGQWAGQYITQFTGCDRMVAFDTLAVRITRPVDAYGDARCGARP